MVPVVLGAALQAAPADVSLCIQPDSGFDKWTAPVFRRELDRLAGRPLRVANCDQPARVRLLIAARPPEPEPDALGSARTQGSMVRPELAVYVEPVARLTDTRLPLLLGRSLARVAAHELSHYLLQTTAHQSEGPLSETVTGAKLLAAPDHHFAVPSAGAWRRRE